MNCYTDKFGNKYYCLNPINPYHIYSGRYNHLFCENDYSENLFHRLDGPSVESISGNNYWFYHGKEIRCKDHKEFLKIISMKAFL